MIGQQAVASAYSNQDLQFAWQRYQDLLLFYAQADLGHRFLPKK